MGNGDKKLAENVRRLMDERGLTYRRLADDAARSGFYINYTTFYNIVRGINDARLHTLRAIKTALGVTWDELLD